MSRIRDPKCGHRRRGIVHAESGIGRASTIVCARPECIEDAKRWVREISGEAAVWLPDRGRLPAEDGIGL
jgi:hypothetical protein